ncbi:type IV secretion system protein [Burkholderia cenocepacia]|uniref:type IV secretion system protein n=1 Tax=Burkholderia cenocepacia TaxID=95486 RepID=UPI002AB620EE|nr:type IV secretion system protein [Burkholderia cenocepacia]
MNTTKRKQFAAVILAAAALNVPTARADGVPTFDLQTIMQLKQQYDTLMETLNKAKEQYQAVTGMYYRGKQIVDSAKEIADAIPGSWQDIVNLQKSGKLGKLTSNYESIIKTLPVDQFMDKTTAANYKMATDAVRNGLVISQSLYDEAQSHIDNFKRLANQVDATANIKDAADLQNAMSAELGMAQASQAKLAAMSAQLLANQMNDVNQSRADRERFFTRTK